MKPYVWAIVGALGASVVWMCVLEWMVVRVAQLCRLLGVYRAALAEAHALVRATLTQSTRMAILVVDQAPTTKHDERPVGRQDDQMWVAPPGRLPC